MALVETKDLSLSPKKVILLFLHPCRVYLFLSLRLFLFFLAGPRYVCLTPPNFSHLFSFLFAKRLCERQRAAFFSNGKEKSSSLPLEEDEDKKKTTRGGTEQEDPKQKLLWNLKTFLSLIFVIFYYSFPVLQYFKGKIFVVSFLITIFFTFSQL